MRRPRRLSGGTTRPLPRRAAIGVIVLCGFFVVAIVTVGVVGVIGVRSTTADGTAITSNELATATATARLSRAADAAVAMGRQLESTQGSATAGVQTLLLSQAIPLVDTSLISLVALHRGDGPAEAADIRKLQSQWQGVRAELIAPLPGSGASSALAKSFQPMSDHLDALIQREDADAAAGAEQATDTMDSTILKIVLVLIATVIAALGLAMFGIRRVRAALRPEEDQSEFADTMQLADDETEAHLLLRRHLERAVPSSAVTVLNRNNSADRLEAVTDLPAGSSLSRTLTHADPRSCLAVRSGRTHRRAGEKAALLGCLVCSECPGSTTCTPLTVGGEVIGSVLVNAPYPPSEEEEARVRTSVSQAAPILANLRNLAIAETRAATDALTGLPNKRAVNDTLKRMVAQASRTLTPMAVLSLDLDHFKDINDRHGHPVGDQALANVGAALSAVLRDSDFAGRNGGEEFAVILPSTDLQGAAQVAERIRASIAEIHVNGGNEYLSASIGVAIYPLHATSAEQLERLADAALYVAKRSGRNRVEVARTGQLEERHEEAADLCVPVDALAPGPG